MKYAMFLGCTAPGRGRNYEMSARRVAERLGVELVDMPEFACCGFSLVSAHRETSLAMAARDLSIAEAEGLPITTLCSSCAGALTHASLELAEEPELKERVNGYLATLGRSYEGPVAVKHFARMLYEDVGCDRIRSEVKRDITGLKVATHYGCHYIKPSKIYDEFDPVEDPSTLDDLLAAVGAQAVRYMDKKRCCGGSVLAFDEKVAMASTKAKLDDVRDSDANAMTVVCPFCNVMYDDNQRKVESTFQEKYGIPVLNLPQIIGLALGIDEKELGLRENRVKTKGLLATLEPAPAHSET